jgi:TRAP-type C4-dicarboxylate transport system substrate-binding protein
MKKLLFISLAVILLGGLVFSSCAESTPAQPKQTIVLRLSQAEPPDDWMAVENIKMAERFNARAGGAYKMEIYAGEQLVKMPENLDSVRTGAVEMMDVGWGAFAGADPRLGAVELPFFFNNLDAEEAAQPDLLELYGPIFGKFNQKPLGCYSLGALELISTRPVKTLADWKGLLCQAISPQVSALLNGLGASAVAIPFPEAYSSLQKKVIEATIQGVPFFDIGKLWEVAKYATIGFMIPATHGYTINMDVWNKMPQNIKDILADETKKSAATLNGVFRGLYTDTQPKVAGLGVEVYKVPAAERAKWQAMMQPYIQSQLEKMGAEGTKVKQIADKMNSKYSKP